MKRFFDKVDKTDTCWNWTAYLQKDGYGCFGFNKGSVLAHRFSYELHKGKIPEGLYVLHKCHNPKCVNPDHLYAGTQKDNMDDMRMAGRSNKMVGEKNGRARLSESEVIKIRALKESGVCYSVLADLYGTSKRYIARITANKVWKHI